MKRKINTVNWRKVLTALQLYQSLDSNFERETAASILTL